MPLRNGGPMKQIRRSVKYVLLYLLLMLPSTLSAGQQPSVPEFIAVEPKTGVTTPGTKVMVYGSGFSLDSVVYFGGLEARETKFLSSSMIEVVTPYLRPGAYQLQLKSGEVTVRSEVSFTATPSPIDSEIDRAVTLAGQRQAPAAIAILQNIAKTSSDYQVRAFAHYQSGQVYFALGDWWRWGGEVGGIFETEAGRAPQTSWQYRLAYDESVYLLPIDSDPETALRLADWTVKYDVTDNPEPRFFRALVNARYGHLVKAKTDSDSILKLEPDNQSYQALAAYIAVLSREKRQLRSISRESI